jgi:hypothetical protein
MDDVSTGHFFDVNNVGEANGEYEQQRSLTLTRTTTTNTADAIIAVITPLVPFFEVNNVSQAQANQGHTLEFNYAGQANQEYEQQRGLMTTMTMTTNIAGGIVAVIPSLLLFFRLNDVSQVQVNQERQQHMSTTTTMTSVAIAATTPPISPPAVIQPVLPLAPNNGQNDILPSSINVPTSSHLHNELQIRDVELMHWKVCPAIYIMNFRYGMVN